MSKTITLEAVANETFMDITIPVAQTQLILRSYRVDLLSSAIPYRNLGISIGGIVGSSFIIDNQQGSNFFRLPIQTNPTVTVGGTANVVSTFVENCAIPLTMAGPLDRQFFLRVYYLDRTVTPNLFKLVPNTDLLYITMVFEAI